MTIINTPNPAWAAYEVEVRPATYINQNKISLMQNTEQVSWIELLEEGYGSPLLP